MTTSTFTTAAAASATFTLKSTGARPLLVGAITGATSISTTATVTTTPSTGNKHQLLH